MTYLKAIEAGVDVIDTATVPMAFGNSQPATEMVVTALIGTPYDSELDLEKLFAIAKYFETVRIEGGWERGVTSLTHMQVYSHQVPGGMISNLESQLKEQNALDRLPEVLEEIPVVRAEVGFPPLVTPMSQIVGTQAVLNVLSGKRWHIVPDEMKAYLRGRYGAAPGPVSAEIIERVLGDERPITRAAGRARRRDARRRARRGRRPGPLRRGRPVVCALPADGAHLPGASPPRARARRVRHAGARLPHLADADRRERSRRRPRQGHHRHGRGERPAGADPRRGRRAHHGAQDGPRGAGRRRRRHERGRGRRRAGRLAGRRREQRLPRRALADGGHLLPRLVAGDRAVRRPSATPSRPGRRCASSRR